MERVKAFIAAASTYFREVIGELNKVVWPTPARTAKLTGVVIGIVVLIMGYLFLLDLPLGIGLEKVVVR
ncbi:MAG TPA: preprotein translocase subunit SecE [Symbiobacteriaceae bacterium]|nr:preprotein translocase subunit SecE [Symbiobacteriaceae bacterium]